MANNLTTWRKLIIKEVKRLHSLKSNDGKTLNSTASSRVNQLSSDQEAITTKITSTIWTGNHAQPSWRKLVSLTTKRAKSNATSWLASKLSLNLLGSLESTKLSSKKLTWVTAEGVQLRQWTWSKSEVPNWTLERPKIDSLLMIRESLNQSLASRIYLSRGVIQWLDIVNLWRLSRPICNF